MLDSMAKNTTKQQKKKQVFEALSYKKQLSFGEKEFADLASDAAAAGFSSVNEAVRYWCRTHPERPCNKKG
jgi:hypothetical protein